MKLALVFARQASAQTTQIFENAMAQGKITLSDLLEFNYQEINGELVGELSYFFDIAKVPEEVFCRLNFLLNMIELLIFSQGNL